MASTYSTSLKLTLIGDGDQTGTWGQTTNANFGTLLEQAIVGQTTITMANADYTLTNLNGALDEARGAVLIITGNQNATFSVIVPAVPKLYIVTNNLSGSAIAYIKPSGGSTFQVPYSRTMYLYTNGTTFYALDYVTNAQNLVTGGTITTGAINCTSLTSSGGIIGTTGAFSGAITGTTIGGTTITASTQFTGPGTGLTGTAASLNIGGTALNITASSNTSLTSLSNLVTVGTITSGTWSGSFGAVSGANLTNITGANVTGTVANATNATTATNLSGGTVSASTISGTTITASTQFSGPGTGLTGTAASLTVGTAATVSTTVASGAVGTTQASSDSSTKIATTAFVQAVVQALYPIGSIYSSTSATNPQATFGFGTWIAYAAGRVLVGAGGAFSGTGGSADAVVVSHSHGGVTQSQNQNHVHTYNKLESVGSGGNIEISGGTTWNFGNGNTEANNVGHVHQIDTDGVSGTNANMQPYQVVYMWTRTA